MKTSDILNKTKELFPYISTELFEEQQGRIKVDNERFLNVLAYLRNSSFVHLANIFAVDWIEEKEFELNYNLWSYDHNSSIIVKVGIPREKPEVTTVLDLWEHGQVYEQEIHEFFGIEFAGNPDLSPLFLHNWKEIPPMRKDFDTEEYSRRAFDVGEREGAK
ncbi:NADH-quinone oxidoreductase subunit C [Candidatus Calescamantes bacterium]|nr:NADH-quinone oxidoreductase subunit C [Candidatus Calescamantes bacterium]